MTISSYKKFTKQVQWATYPATLTLNKLYISITVLNEPRSTRDCRRSLEAWQALISPVVIVYTHDYNQLQVEWIYVVGIQSHEVWREVEWPDEYAKVTRLTTLGSGRAKTRKTQIRIQAFKWLSGGFHFYMRSHWMPSEREETTGMRDTRCKKIYVCRSKMIPYVCYLS